MPMAPVFVLSNMRMRVWARIIVLNLMRMGVPDLVSVRVRMWTFPVSCGPLVHHKPEHLARVHSLVCVRMAQMIVVG